MAPTGPSIRTRRPLTRWGAYGLSGVIYGFGTTLWRLAVNGAPLGGLFSGPPLARALSTSLAFAILLGVALEVVAWFRTDRDDRGDQSGAA
jgi:hypothetical protein